MRLAAKLIAAQLLLLATACMPFPHGGYYRPEMQNSTGELVRRSCGGQVGPEEVLKISVTGVEMRFRFKDRDGGIDGHIALLIPDGTSFAFVEEDFVLIDAEAGKIVPVQHKGLGSYDVTARRPVDEPLQTVLKGRIARSVNLYASSYSSSHFRLKVPAFNVDGKIHRLDPIDFRYRALDFGIYPFNC